MSVWKAKITNQVRLLPEERCVTDRMSGEVICKKIYKYKFDNKVTPRCENLKKRSVFYALRKNLKCVKPFNKKEHLKNKRSGFRIIFVLIGNFKGCVLVILTISYYYWVFSVGELTMCCIPRTGEIKLLYKT
uniref:Uncharacterized protein n=1 Tax=Megaselia scalaris TaxID=36166 RepID=T1GKP4_MEGSC